GWIVYIDLNNDGYQTTDPSATSDATGTYRIYGLSPNTTYALTLNTNSQSGFFTTSNTQISITTNSNAYQLVSNQNFGVLEYATITGTVNFTGVNGSTTVPSNWTLSLLGSSGTVVQTQTVNSNGTYTFANIRPGNYTIEQNVQSTWLQTSPVTATY